MLGLPINASAHGSQIDDLIGWVHILMAVLFVGWGLFFIFTLVRFNRAFHPKADYHGVKSHLSSYLEITVAVIEAVLLIGFSIPFWSKQVDAFPNRKDTVTVHIVAEQFAWNIHYPGADGIFGKTDPKLIDKQSNPLGLDPNDPNGKDDIVTINQLNIPIGHPILVYLSSKDVIHSFTITLMRVKQDVIPGMVIPTWFTPTKLGKYEISCAQLCGIGHYRMKAFVTVQRPEEFDKWVAEQSKASSSSGSDSFWN